MIRIGIVGCGRILNAHLQGFKQLRDKGVDKFRITALVARREEDAWMFHTRGKGPAPRPSVLPFETGDPLAAPHTYVSDFQNDANAGVFTDYREMIDRGVADAVLDTTPVFLHHQIGLAAIEAGMHVLTQKPLAVSVRAGQMMLDKAKRKGVTLAVFENARYRPLVRAARWAFETGILGEPQLAVIGSLGGLWSPDAIVAETPWRHDKLLAGGGGTIDIGVHQMHVLRYVMGEIVSVQALVRTFEPMRRMGAESSFAQKANVDDTYLAGITFENDSVAQLLWSWAGHGKPLEIPGTPAFFGSGGCIQNDKLILDDGAEQSLLELFQRDLNDADRERWFPHGLQDPYAVLQLQWLNGITKSGAGPETGGDEGLRDLAAAYAMLESAHARRAVTLSEVLDGSVTAYQDEINQHYQLVD